MDNQLINSYPIPVNALRYFYWAAKLTSFKLAAEKLHVSEAAISQQIRNLESTLKVKLFHRGHQKITLTHKAKRLFPFIQTAFINIQEGINAIASDPHPNRLNLSTIPSYATNWLIKRLAKFNQVHPNLSISIDTSIEILDSELHPQDISIRYGTGNYPDLKSEFLLNDPVVLVCHPKLVTNGIITQEDFLKIPAIIGTSCTVKESMEAFKKYYQVCNQTPQETLLLTDGSLGVEAARNGQGLCLQRLSLVVDLIESGELVYATDYAFREFSFYAVAPETNFENEKIILFLDWLKKEMKLTENQIAPHILKIKN